MSLSEKLNILLDQSKSFGLSEVDYNTAKEFLEYNEYGLCFDTIITQMFEYDILINEEFYNRIVEIAQKMDVKEEEYTCIQELIR